MAMISVLPLSWLTSVISAFSGETTPSATFMYGLAKSTFSFTFVGHSEVGEGDVDLVGGEHVHTGSGIDGGVGRLHAQILGETFGEVHVVAGVVAVLVDIAERGLVGEHGHLELTGLFDFVGGYGRWSCSSWSRSQRGPRRSGLLRTGRMQPWGAAMINAADAATMFFTVLLMIDAVMVSPLFKMTAITIYWSTASPDVRCLSNSKVCRNCCARSVRVGEESLGIIGLFHDATVFKQDDLVGDSARTASHA